MYLRTWTENLEPYSMQQQPVILQLHVYVPEVILRLNINWEFVDLVKLR